MLTVRLLIVATVGAGSAALVGSAPATSALITGAITWLLLTGPGDLAHPDEAPDHHSYQVVTLGKQKARQLPETHLYLDDLFQGISGHKPGASA